MHRMAFWHMFSIELDSAIEIAMGTLTEPSGVKELVTWGGPSLAKRSFRNAFAASWDMLDGHPGDQVRARWDLD